LNHAGNTLNASASGGGIGNPNAPQSGCPCGAGVATRAWQGQDWFPADIGGKAVPRLSKSGRSFTMGKNNAKTYKKVEIVGTSDKSVSEAVENALSRASKTLKNLDWFEVTEIRGAILKGKPQYQVTMKVGFRLE
jgi:dodecin